MQTQTIATRVTPMDIATVGKPLNPLTPVKLPKQKNCWSKYSIGDKVGLMHVLHSSNSLTRQIAASATPAYVPSLKLVWQTYICTRLPIWLSAPHF